MHVKMKSAEHLSFLFKLSSLLLLTPFYNTTIGKFKVNKVYLCCVILVLTGHFALTLYYYTTSKDYRVADLLFNYVLQGCAIVALQVRGVCHGSPLNDLFRKFDEIARLFERGFDVEPFRPKYVWLICSLPNLIWTFWAGASIWREFDGTPMMLTRLLLQYLIAAYLLNSAILQFCSVRHLTAYFERFVWVLAGLKFEADTVTTAAYLHKYLCDAGDLINDHFGWSMLICTVSNCLFVLKIIQMVLQYSPSEFFVVYLITKTLLCTIAIVAVIVECQRYYSFARRVKRVVEELQLRWQGEVSKALSLLAQQTSQPLSKVTAADFFAMDYSLLFTLANLMATYIIVILQTSK